MLVPNLQIGERFLAAYPPPGEVMLVGITGAHLYGFPSPDSDLDLKGIHLCPADDFLGLGNPKDTHDALTMFEGVECDLTTHEARKALSLLVKGNGNMIERIVSPLQLVQGPRVDELQGLALRSVNKRFWGHYRGFTKGMRREYRNKRRAKAALYVYRAALTGIHLLNTGEIVADLGDLAEDYGFPEILPLIEHKRTSGEKVPIGDQDDQHHRENWDRLEEMLDEAKEQSSLPDQCPVQDELSEWLVQVRRATL